MKQEELSESEKRIRELWHMRDYWKIAWHDIDQTQVKEAILLLMNVVLSECGQEVLRD